MENVKFIKEIVKYTGINDGDKIIAGDCIYTRPAAHTDNIAKLYCERDCVKIEIINISHGLIDSVTLPFANYFDVVRNNKLAPERHPYISGNAWYWEENNPRVRPKESDYKRLGVAIDNYITRLFCW